MSDIGMDEFISKLNRDLEEEYKAAIQYVQHASVISGPEYNSIRDELGVHADEEIQHAKQLADQIDYLGGEPSVDVAEVHVSPEAVEMLEQDLEGERDAIERYEERIRQAEELGEFATSETLRGILVMEQEHEMDLVDALGR